MSKPKLTIVEEGSRKRTELPLAPDAHERSLAELLALHGFPLNTRCGQRGTCRGCTVDLMHGDPELSTGARGTQPGQIRSCLARIRPGTSITVGIPNRARLSFPPQVGETFAIDVPYELDPLFTPSPGRDTAFAVDLGTTTVVVLLLDLATGETLSRAGGFNEQIRFGDNVLTRIATASTPASRREMQRAVAAETILPLLLRACERAGRDPARLLGGAIAGNTTMLHLLLGEDPASLGVAPFTPLFLEARTVTATALGLGESIPPDLPIQLLPGLAAYVGADITAGIHATGMALDTTPSLLVDMGTNGEVVLQVDGQFHACATAAGPAFEGSGLTSGTRAQAGAISDIAIARDPFSVDIETIGAVLPPTGICGSGYLDFLASGRSSGLLKENGRFDLDFWTAVPMEQRSTDECAIALRLVPNPGSPAISEVDVALLLQAKAAIGAGIETLLALTNTPAKTVGRVYLAGGFGLHLDVAHAIATGLLPGFRTDQVRVVGNTALAGALLVLVDRSALAEMESLRSRVDVIELNSDPNFEDRYIDHLHLP